MSSNWKIAWRPAAVVVAALTLSVCGGDASNGTPPGGPSVPVTPTPTPAALAPPAESPLAASCLSVSPGSTSYRCDERGANFQRELEEAISLLKAQKPEVFDGETVLNVGAYVVGIIKNLDTQGVVSTYDGEELVVRGQDDFS